MESLEERVLGSLRRIQTARPDCAKHMFVFPVPLFTPLFSIALANLEMVQDGPVLMVCRPDPV